MSIPYGPILIVEDIPNVQEMLEVILRFKGYPVVTANNGQEALEKIALQRPAMVITDLLMPKMDGYTLAHSLRKYPQTSQIPIVFVSATYITPEDQRFAMSLGGVRFLEKPIDTEDFLLTVAEILTQDLPELPSPLDDEEFYREGGKGLRSSCILDASKLLRAGIKLRSVEAALADALERLTLTGSRVLMTDTAFERGNWRDALQVVAGLRPSAELVVAAQLADERLWLGVLERGVDPLAVAGGQEVEQIRIGLQQREQLHAGRLEATWFSLLDAAPACRLASPARRRGHVVMACMIRGGLRLRDVSSRHVPVNFRQMSDSPEGRGGPR